MQKADALEHNISLFSHKMALAIQKAGALEMLLDRYFGGTRDVEGPTSHPFQICGSLF